MFSARLPERAREVADEFLLELRPALNREPAQLGGLLRAARHARIVALDQLGDAEPRRSYRDVLLTDSQGGALLHDGYVSIEL